MLYLPGLKNVVADFMSRPIPPPPQSEGYTAAAAAAVEPIDFEEMAAEQTRCGETQGLLGGSAIKVVSRREGQHDLLGDISTGEFRAIVPLTFRKQIFLHVHNIAHPGRLATRRLLSSRFVWRGLAADATLWARECMACQQSKVHRHVRLQPLKIPIPQRRFSHIHVDLVGPLLNSNGFTHLFTIIDRTSHWMEAVPLVQTTAAACAKVLLSHWVSRFGVPQILTSDRGPQFTSNVWFELC